MIKKTLTISALSALAVLAISAVSCGGDENTPDWPWDEPEKPEIPVNPDPGPEPEPDPDGPGSTKRSYVWIDASANFKWYANDKAYIEADLKRIREMGFTDVIVDVRPTCGDVLFTTDKADPLLKTDIWAGGYHWEYRTENFDYLQAFIDAAKPLGLGVCAAINTFVAGCHCYYGLGTDGPAYRHEEMRDWMTVVNTADGLVNTLDMGEGAKFLNPAHDKAQEYVLGIISDLARYDIDGIVLDRCRYDDNGMMSDFSETTRAKFEEYAGHEIADFPAGIMAPGTTGIPSKISSDFKLWMEFRAKTMHDFVEKASRTVHAVNPDMKFGVYVGGWLSSYYPSGVNWASPDYSIRSMSSYSAWATKKYQECGYADHCDFMFIGAYAGTGSIHGSGEWTMEGFCRKAGDYLKGATPYFGGPDIGNSTGFENGGVGNLMPDIVKTCMDASSGGMFVFDLCHIRMYDYWKDFEKAFSQYYSGK